MFQTDNNFARTYGVEGLNSSTNTNTVYLTGVGERNFFDMRGYYFDVQTRIWTIRPRRAGDRPASHRLQLLSPELVAAGQLSGT